MAFWLLKSDPDEYSFDDLLRDKRATWDGVSNNQALIYLRQMKKGDRVFVYPTGDEKGLGGLADIACAPRAHSGDATGKLVVVDVLAKRRLAKPVPLADIKADLTFADCPLVRIPRLSVMPIDDVLAKRLLEMAGG